MPKLFVTKYIINCGTKLYYCGRYSLLWSNLDDLKYYVACMEKLKENIFIHRLKVKE